MNKKGKKMNKFELSQLAHKRLMMKHYAHGKSEYERYVKTNYHSSVYEKQKKKTDF